MKQHITKEQLDELTPKGMKKLEEWIESKLMPPIKGSAYIGPLSSQVQVCYFMAIGQMIEFLTEKAQINIRTISQWHGGGTELIIITFPEELTETELENSTHVYKMVELRDALWKAVKEILNS